eukprot:12095368-Heterocapsa_arctica.AAC.1
MWVVVVALVGHVALVVVDAVQHRAQRAGRLRLRGREVVDREVAEAERGGRRCTLSARRVTRRDGDDARLLKDHSVAEDA